MQTWNLSCRGPPRREISHVLYLRWKKEDIAWAAPTIWTGRQTWWRYQTRQSSVNTATQHSGKCCKGSNLCGRKVLPPCQTSFRSPSFGLKLYNRFSPEIYGTATLPRVASSPCSAFGHCAWLVTHHQTSPNCQATAASASAAPAAIQERKSSITMEHDWDFNHH